MIHTNPKRQRGRADDPSLARRVGMDTKTSAAQVTGGPFAEFFS